WLNIQHLIQKNRLWLRSLRSLRLSQTNIAKEINYRPQGTLPFLFAHLGDGNFHATISTGYPIAELEADIVNTVYKGLNEMGGSFSAEHGIGIEKRRSLQKHVPDINHQLMKTLKTALDPNNIMNPGKVL
ncbi:MAG: hypothetical protein GKR96_12835, partial [Gammaproteobacteria bacterium]|nr:hypothetical protein [Gammaproteobacteria bacterium]